MEQLTDPGSGVSLGRIVHYVVAEHDLPRLRECGGNSYAVGDIIPASIVRLWGGSVNIKCHTDAPRDYWATSVQFAVPATEVETIAAGEKVSYEPGSWHWPPRVG